MTRTHNEAVKIFVLIILFASCFCSFIPTAFAGQNNAPSQKYIWA